MQILNPYTGQHYLPFTYGWPLAVNCKYRCFVVREFWYTHSRARAHTHIYTQVRGQLVTADYTLYARAPVKQKLEGNNFYDYGERRLAAKCPKPLAHVLVAKNSVDIRVWASRRISSRIQLQSRIEDVRQPPKSQEEKQDDVCALYPAKYYVTVHEGREASRTDKKEP